MVDPHTTKEQASRMIADRPIIGILFIVGFCIFAPMGDAAAKAISLATPMMMILLLIMTSR